MIETTQTVSVRAGIAQAWGHVHDIRNWAELMPGLQDYQIVDDDNSRWVLKVGVGALVRTVKVEVHVDEWNGPGDARFSFRLQGDPVRGEGSYVVAPRGRNATEMTLTIRVEGTGPMAPMWEAMASPLMPRFALAFARQLAEGIEMAAGEPAAAASEATSAGILSQASAWLRGLWRGAGGVRT